MSRKSGYYWVQITHSCEWEPVWYSSFDKVWFSGYKEKTDDFFYCIFEKQIASPGQRVDKMPKKSFTYPNGK